MGWLGEADRAVTGMNMLSQRDPHTGRATVFVPFFSQEGQPLMPALDTGPSLVFTADVAHLDAVLKITHAVLYGLPFLVSVAIVVGLRWAARRSMHRKQSAKQAVAS